MRKFNCDGCGICCRSVGHLYPFIESVDGICTEFDSELNKCKIYDSRPLICRVDDYYKTYGSDNMTLDEWHDENTKACKLLKEKFIN